jgi:hypothetical protein
LRSGWAPRSRRVLQQHPKLLVDQVEEKSRKCIRGYKGSGAGFVSIMKVERIPGNRVSNYPTYTGSWFVDL